MKRRWTEEEMIERRTLSTGELALLSNKSGATRIGFAVLLRFFAGERRFPRSKGEAAGQVVPYPAEQVGVPAEEYLRYDWGGRSIKYHRARIREHFGFREATALDGEMLASWLAEEVLPREQAPGALREAFYGRCRALKLEPPAEGQVERVSKGAVHQMTPSFARSLVRHGIVLNTVNPGPTDTSYLSREEIEETTKLFPQGRWGEPEDVARLVGWLCMDEAGWVVG